MNIANPCKLFFIVGALAVGLGVRADGTLPIPFAQTELPFVMSGSLTGVSGIDLGDAGFPAGLGSSSNLDLSMVLDLADSNAAMDPRWTARCRSTESFYRASGSVQVAEDLYEVQGICAPGAVKPGKRQIIATSTGRILQFDGDFSVNGTMTKSFRGEVLTIDSVTSSPESGQPGKKVFTFELNQ